MALKFQCKNCGEDIAIRFLEIGEAVKCRNCGASNSVPESAEKISDEPAKSIAKAPVFESAEDIRAEAISEEPAPSVPIAKTLRIIGKILISFGVIAGIMGALRVITLHPAPDQTIALAVSMGVTGLGITFFFSILSVLCLGIAKVTELLSK